MTLRESALEALLLDTPEIKARWVREYWMPDVGQALPSGTDLDLAAPADRPLPGRPARPTLRPPKEVASRSPFTLEGRAALVHALCHIEFNAINLALDAVWRFAGLPESFYRDWWRVASEEALHFTLLREHLLTLGYDYGDFDAHDGLWQMAEKTQHDLLARMALVPRTLEARGLDATPAIQDKFRRAGDDAAAHILDIILRDEVGHVAIGNQWYRSICTEREVDPIAAYPELVRRYAAPRLRPPFNEAARRRAGFSEEELALLHSFPSPTGL